MLQTRDKIEARGLKPEKLRRSRTGNATAVILASDFHVGATVDPAEVDGANCYNVAIAKQRIEKLWQKSVRLVEFCQNLSHIDEVVLWLGGDVIESSLFRPEMAETNELGPAEAVLLVQDLLASGIDFLRKELRMPLLVATSNGNHARTEKEKRSHGAYNHSLEHILYSNLERKFHSTPRVSFKVERGIHNWVDIRGFPIVFQHGDAMKYAGGVGGAAIPIRRAIGRWSQRKKAACWVLGHFHSYLSDWSFICNGSLIGYDSYAMQIAAEWQPPVQGFMVVGPPYGKLFDIPLFVSEDKA